MTTYHLPEGMTADVLRDLAANLKESSSYALEHNVADKLNAWADAIDPPKPEPVVTDEMVEDGGDAADMGNVYATGVRKVLEAVERLGWLRDPSREYRSIAEMGEDAVLGEDFYRCSNTGEWVYKWADERMVLLAAALEGTTDAR